MTVFRNETDSQVGQAWWRTRRVLIGAAVLLLLASILLTWRSCHQNAAAEGEGNIVVSVAVARAEHGVISNDITTVATLVPEREAAITPRVSAQITELGLVLNRHFRAGDVIARLESKDLTSQRSEAAASVQEAEATSRSTIQGSVPLTIVQDTKGVRDARAALENATKTYERRKTLFAEGGVSKKELEGSQLAVVNAEDDLRLAEASSAVHRDVTNPADITAAGAKATQARDRLANLDAQVGYTVIRAPFDGTVTGQFQHDGDLATPSTRLLTFADTSSLIAKMQMGGDSASSVAVGDHVKVFPDDTPGEGLDGTVSLAGRAADPQSGSIEVWVRVANPAGRLRANGLAKVVIAAQATTGALVIPTAALTLDATNANGGTVMVVDGGSIAHEVHVTTGIHGGGKTQILSGLKEGDQVVTVGNYALPDGTKVAVSGAPATSSEDGAKKKDGD